MYRALIVVTDKTQYWIDGVAIEQTFQSLNVTPPNADMAVISTELQLAIATCGIVVPVIGEDQVKMNKFIPPYQILEVYFFVTAEDRPKYLDVEKIIRENKNADL